jgi:hypothetical protein
MRPAGRSVPAAFNDFHSGKFGQIPRQARLKVR